MSPAKSPEPESHPFVSQSGLFIPSWTAPIILAVLLTVAGLVTNWSSTSSKMAMLDDKIKDYQAELVHKSSARDLQIVELGRRISAVEAASERVTRIEEQISSVRETLRKIELLLDTGRIRFEGKSAVR